MNWPSHALLLMGGAPGLQLVPAKREDPALKGAQEREASMELEWVPTSGAALSTRAFALSRAVQMLEASMVPAPRQHSAALAAEPWKQDPVPLAVQPRLPSLPVPGMNLPSAEGLRRATHLRLESVTLFPWNPACCSCCARERSAALAAAFQQQRVALPSAEEPGLVGV